MVTDRPSSSDRPKNLPNLEPSAENSSKKEAKLFEWPKVNSAEIPEVRRAFQQIDSSDCDM